MKAVMSKRPLTIHNQTLHPQQPYLVYNQTFDVMTSQMDKRDLYARQIELPMWDGVSPVENLLIFGGGGMGDRIQQTCALRKLSQKLGKRLDIAAGRALEWVGLDYIGNVYEWMPQQVVVDCYDAVCSFENILGHADEHTTHLAELFAQRLHVGPLAGGESAKDPQEFKCDYVVQPWETRGVPLPTKETTWIALQVRSNGQSRNWPREHVVRLAEMLGKRKDTTCLLIGAGGDFQVWRSPADGWAHAAPNPPNGVVNLCGQFASIRQLAVFLGHCDLVIGPDSGPMHLAGALDVPSVCLYGPHTYETRGAWFAKQTGITSQPVPPDDRCPCYCHSDQTNGTMPCGSQYC